MTTATTVLPPPLSDAPSVETLELLLAGLHQPMQRGVPTPPRVDRRLDLTLFDAAPAETATPVAPPVPAPPPAPVAPAVPAPEEPMGTTATAPTLSWSAGRRRTNTTATGLGVALATAAGMVAALAAAGELSLP